MPVEAAAVGEPFVPADDAPLDAAEPLADPAVAPVWVAPVLPVVLEPDEPEQPITVIAAKRVRWRIGPPKDAAP